MNQSGRIAAPSAITATLAFLLFPTTLLADSLYVAAATGENVSGTNITTCLVSSASAAACGTTQAAGSLSAGTGGDTSDASSLLPNQSGINAWTAAAEAIFTYNNTVSIQTGSILYTLDITGTYRVIGNVIGTAGAGASITIPPSESFVGASRVITSAPGNYVVPLLSGDTVVQILAPISQGLSTFTFNLATSAFCPGLTALQFSQGYSCEAIADFLDPTTITSAAVYDPNGNLVPGATVISDTGYSPPAATPEPPSITLLSIAFASLGLVLRRRGSPSF